MEEDVPIIINKPTILTSDEYMYNNKYQLHFDGFKGHDCITAIWYTRYSIRTLLFRWNSNIIEEASMNIISPWNTGMNEPITVEINTEDNYVNLNVNTRWNWSLLQIYMVDITRVGNGSLNMKCICTMREYIPSES